MSHYITTGFLNVRKEPIKKDGNILAVIPPDTVVLKLDEPQEKLPWFNVKVILGNTAVTGYASSAYLVATQLQLPQITAIQGIKPVHLPDNGKQVTRNDTARVARLNETGLVKVNLQEINNVSERITHIHEIIAFLDVEHSKRYAPGSGKTYCNIYAYDVAYCTGAFLPRVWWTKKAVESLLAGEDVAVKYGITVSEYTANMITDWFEKFGNDFGWKRLFTLTELQDKVNEGKLGIIVAQRIDTTRSGHIVAVVPETNTLKALRNGTEVVLPLQSQAGVKNKKYFTGYKWWEDKTRFKKFGFWVWP